jgi:hypothetical protein
VLQGYGGWCASRSLSQGIAIKFSVHCFVEDLKTWACSLVPHNRWENSRMKLRQALQIELMDMWKCINQENNNNNNAIEAKLVHVLCFILTINSIGLTGEE